MSIIKVDSKVEKYRQLAKSQDLEALSGRTGRPDVTQFVAANICSAIDIGDGDTVVDIGCGDGTLLAIAAEHEVQAFGILPTEEEVGRVSDRFNGNANVQITQGLSTETRLPDACANKIVCSAVLIALEDREEVKASLAEIRRIAKQGAAIYIGEVPFRDESEGKDYGNSISKWLIWVLKNQGIGNFLRQLKTTLMAAFSDEPFIIAPKEHFFCQTEQFISLAADYNLKNTASFVHRSVDAQGAQIESNSRQDYTFIAS